MKTNPRCAGAVFDKVKVSGLQAAIDGAGLYPGKGGRLLGCHLFYFTGTLLAPAALSRRAPPDRQRATRFDRDFRSSPAHSAARQCTGRGATGPSIQAACN
jgi:hypothetical protein